MPLHGYTKIELTDVKTGKVETHEKHNLVTNAVQNILSGFDRSLNLQTMLADKRYSNDSGSDGDITNLITAFYGGLYLYDTPLGSNPDTLFAPAGAALVGTALQNTANTGTNPYRGSYNQAESSVDIEKGVVTFVYDFATNQANGTIASVCLTSPRGAYMCEADTVPAALQPSTNPFTQMGPEQRFLPKIKGFDYYSGHIAPIWADEEKQLLVMGRIIADGEQQLLELRYHDLQLNSLDLFDPGSDVPKEIKTFSLQGLSLLPKDDSGSYHRIYADVERGKLYVSSVKATPVKPGEEMRVREFDMNTFAYTDYHLTNTSGENLRGLMSGMRGPWLGGTVYDGWLYMQASYTKSGTKEVDYYRFRLTDSSQVEYIPTNDKGMYIITDAHDGRIYSFVGSDRGTPAGVLNTATGKVYSTERSDIWYSDSSSDNSKWLVIPTVGGGASPLVTGPGGTNYASIRRMVRPNYLGTINDLDAPVEKTPDKTMKITYTLRREA